MKANHVRTPWIVKSKWYNDSLYDIYDAEGNSVGTIKGKANADFFRIVLDKYGKLKKDS